MSIGAGIFLITVGAILAFGIRDQSPTVDLNVVGVVIMLGGAAGIWLSYYITNRRRRVETQALDPVVEEEYRSVQENSAVDPVSGPMTVTHDAPTNGDRAAGTAPVRRVDLDPTASGLHTPTPNRTAPVASAARTPSPAVSPETQEPHNKSWRRRLLYRVRDRH
jgi:hypothetical protein